MPPRTTQRRWAYKCWRATSVRTTVLLEMGVRGGHHPHQPIAISCLLGDVLKAAGPNLHEFADLEPFEVLVLHPGRTLLEKLVHIHAVAQELAADAARLPDRRSGRHFYDVFLLLGDDRVRDLLADRDQIELVMSSIEEVTRTHFGSSDDTELRPKGSFAASPAFDLDTDVSLRLRAAYEATMPELYFGAGPLPTWDAICRRVAERRAALTYGGFMPRTQLSRRLASPGTERALPPARHVTDSFALVPSYRGDVATHPVEGEDDFATLVTRTRCEMIAAGEHKAPAAGVYEPPFGDDARAAIMRLARDGTYREAARRVAVDDPELADS